MPADKIDPPVAGTVETVKPEQAKVETKGVVPAATPVRAPAEAKAAPKSAAVKHDLPLVKRGRGRPRKTEAEKAATVALRKKAAALKKTAKRGPVVKPVAAKPAPIRSVVTKFERKPVMTDTNLFAGLGVLPGADQFQAAFAEANSKSREALTKSAKVAEELVDLTKANVEALVSSSKIATAGAQALSQDAIAFGKEGVEKASAAVKSFSEAKSPTELVQLQSDYARASLDRLISNSSKLSESFVKLFGEAFEPISTRASVNAERVNSLIA